MYLRYQLSTFLSIALFLMCGAGFSHPADENPDLTLPETTRQFREDRFGMFIHWGVYSVLCDGDSVMKDKDLTLSEYEKLAPFFNPAEFDAAQWVSLAKAAGMRYITFTAKHRDGFAMWDSDVSDWNVVERTPFARDVVKALADECHHEGIKLFVYYSPLDWHHSELIRAGGSEESIGKPDDGYTTATLEYTRSQLTELLTDYGKINGVWLDGWANIPAAEAQLQSIYKTIRKLQPAALIGTNHHHRPFTGEDFQIRDIDLLNQNISGQIPDMEYSPVPTEIPDTINRSRGYRLTDHQHKSTRELIHSLVRAAGSDANYLLNVGPMPNGKIQQEFKDRLHRVGMWLAKNGDSIYATRGGPMAPQPWGVTTHRGKRIYVHVLDPETTSVELQIPSKLRSARYFIDESDVTFESTETTATLTLRPEQRGEMERLIVLESKQYR